ncbi:MAG: hypothetical protein LC795_21155 [Acidobacteria bacterium]|nr:hypothetical protein [Acidobacteriota bacterium]
MRSRARTCLLLALALTLPAAAAAQDKGPCGSAEKFKQTKRWEDLPGCPISYFDNGDLPEANKILNHYKFQYQKFFEDWKTQAGTREFLSSLREGQLRQMRTDYYVYAKAWAGEPQLVAARPAYDEMFRAVEKHVSWLEILVDDSFGGAFEAVLGDIKRKASPESIRVNLENGVVPVLQKLKGAGAPDTLVVALGDGEKSYTIADINALVPSFRSSQKEVEAKVNADYEAKWRPFLSVLRGDRLMLFKKYEVGILQGAGGRTLRTPADFQSTPMMAKFTIDESGVVNRWNMTIWRLRGDRIVATQTRSGWGNEPPSAAFR